MKNLLFALIGLLGSISAFGQNIGSFTLPDVTTEEDFSLTAYKNEIAVVIIFYSGKCAYGEYYLERIKSFNKEFSAKRVKFILINANNSSFVPEESVAEMKEFADQNNIEMPYLADKNQEVKTVLGASRTPEAFILIPEQEKFNVVFKGAIDDSPQSASDVSHAYLKDNLILLLKNNEITANQTRAVGCLIK